jgi:hypothetical protein
MIRTLEVGPEIPLNPLSVVDDVGGASDGDPGGVGLGVEGDIDLGIFLHGGEFATFSVGKVPTWMQEALASEGQLREGSLGKRRGEFR